AARTKAGDFFFADDTTIKEPDYQSRLKSQSGKCTIHFERTIEGDVDIHLTVDGFYSADPCCDCFTGTASWDLNIDPTIGKKRRETHSTAVSIGSDCEGEQCCTVKREIPVDISAYGTSVKGTVSIDGKLQRK